MELEGGGIRPTAANRIGFNFLYHQLKSFLVNHDDFIHENHQLVKEERGIASHLNLFLNASTSCSCVFPEMRLFITKRLSLPTSSGENNSYL